MGNDLLNDLAVDPDNMSLEGIADQLSGTTSNEATETQPVASSTGSSETYTLTLDRPKFSKMTNALKLLENICSDCQIKGGVVRTKTDNRKSIVILDLTSVIEDKDLMFSFLKGKLGLLKTFDLDMNVQADDNNIIITATNDSYEFCDCFSKMNFRKPVEDYLDNKYLDDQSFNSIVNGCNDDALIFTYNVPAYVRSRMAKICDGFKTDSIKFTLRGSFATFGSETKSKDNISQNTTNIPLLQNIDNKNFSLINMPFVIGIESDMKISCYKLSGDFAMVKCELDYSGIPFIIYAKVKIVDENS